MKMNLTVFDDAADFLAVARAALEAQESANGLPLGVALRLAKAKDNAGAYLAAVVGSSGLMFGAIMTPPHNMLLFSPMSPGWSEAMAPLCANLKSRGVAVPGVLGAVQVTALFVQQWTRTMPVESKRGMSQRVHELRKVNSAVVTAPGRFRLADSRDLDLLASWHGESLRSSLATLIEARHIGLWETDRPVCCAAQARPTLHGVAVNLVFTPEPFRRNGYATACVASLCQHLLSSGWQFCYLHTDLANPTSNSIYQKIGFAPVCDFQEYRFETMPNHTPEPIVAKRAEGSV
jgi:GNAT superfamily N-acetyltransferase